MQAYPLSFRVLYVDDSEQRIRAFREAFSASVTVIEKRGKKAALACVEKYDSVDLIVYNSTLDIRGFLAGLRTQPHRAKIPVILLIGSEPFADLHHGHVIDAFPLEYSAAAFRVRLDYLIRKKGYQQKQPSSPKPKPVRLPVWKRTFDIGLSLLILLTLLPLLLIVVVLIKLDSPGPVFYSSKRVGLNFTIFNMYKFRTMRIGSDKLLGSMAAQNLYGKAGAEKPATSLCDDCQLANTPCQHPLFQDQKEICEVLYRREQQAKAMFSKFKEDPRITRLGKLLRNTSIDELPQLFNILRGDMSFVGNRPLPLYEAEKLTSIGYARRFAAPAGLTGLWQVTKRGKAAVSDQERIQLDVLYARRFSFYTDLTIFLRTFKAVWQKENV